MTLDRDAYISHREQVAGNVRAEVARRGMSQASLARALEINQAGVSRRLNGKVDFTASELSLIARALGVPVGTFFGEALAPALAEGGDAA